MLSMKDSSRKMKNLVWEKKFFQMALHIKASMLMELETDMVFISGQTDQCMMGRGRMTRSMAWEPIRGKMGKFTLGNGLMA